MLTPDKNIEIPELTAKVAHAAFPKGNPYLTLRDELGTIFEDSDFTEMYSNTGQPAIAPWRLALTTIVQFRENLSDRQMAEAIRGRIDLKYLLSLQLDHPGYDFSVLSEFRARLLAGHGDILLNKILDCCRDKGLLKERGKQRTDATYVLAAIRTMSRLELVTETMRAALNAIATIAPNWLQGVALPIWYKRYGRRTDDFRLPKTDAKRVDYAQAVGEDGYQLMSLLNSESAPDSLQELQEIATLQEVWNRHYDRQIEGESEGDSQAVVRFKSKRELTPAAQAIESPYDTEARFRRRYGHSWTGYIVHLTESCEEDDIHLITHVETTNASVHESQKTQAIHQALSKKGLLPDEHFVDSAYIDAELLVNIQEQYGVDLFGPTRKNNTWQSKVEGAYGLEDFSIDWENKVVQCPQGKYSTNWKEGNDTTPAAGPLIYAQFSSKDCQPCTARALCTRSKRRRAIGFRPKEQMQALERARERMESEDGKERYKRRAGIEGTISQGVRSFGLRRTRYRGIAKTSLQHVATAAAINVDRLVAWLHDIPQAKTRTSRFAALAPAM